MTRYRHEPSRRFALCAESTAPLSRSATAPTPPTKTVATVMTVRDGAPCSQRRETESSESQSH
jgi:hypothetical protein